MEIFHSKMMQNALPKTKLQTPNPTSQSFAIMASMNTQLWKRMSVEERVKGRQCRRKKGFQEENKSYVYIYICINIYIYILAKIFPIIHYIYSIIHMLYNNTYLYIYIYLIYLFLYRFDEFKKKHQLSSAKPPSHTVSDGSMHKDQS